jgi:hypothetical protein
MKAMQYYQHDERGNGWGGSAIPPDFIHRANKPSPTKAVDVDAR